MKKGSNKPRSETPANDEMRPHYDFDYAKSRPNRFAKEPSTTKNGKKKQAS